MPATTISADERHLNVVKPDPGLGCPTMTAIVTPRDRHLDTVPAESDLADC